MRYYSPSGVADLLATRSRPCSARAVKDAVSRGALKATPIYAAGGAVSCLAITEAAARRWDAERQIGSGRPASHP